MGKAMKLRTGLVAATLALLGTAAPALAAAPPNDLVRHAIVITAPSSTPFDTTHATSSAGDLGCRPDETNTIWYSFTPTVSGTFALRVDGNNLVGVARGPLGALTVINCDSGWPTSFHATAGVRYLIQVAACCASPGPGTLDLVRVYPFTVTVSVNPTGTVTKGVATITGTITCSHREDLRNTDTEWDPYLTQTYQGFAATWSDYYSIGICTPLGTPFTFQAFDYYSGILFGPGTAYFDMPSDVGTCTAFICARSETDPIAAPVRLTRAT
jgi:hypothetical protein